jgi:hypothetical protein
MKNKTNPASLWVSLLIMLMLVAGTSPVSGRSTNLEDFPTAPDGVNEINSLWYVGEIGTPGYADDVVVVGNIAYVADGESGLRIIDVSDPTAPVELGAFDTPNNLLAVDVVGSYAYLVEHQWFYVVDVSDPESPTQVGISSTSSLNYDIVVAGNYAYVGNGYPAGLTVWNISNPTSPFKAGFCPTEWWAWGVAVSGSFVYLATSYDGLNVVNVSNPFNPVEVGHYDMPGGIAEHVEVEGNYAYLAAGYWMHLRIIDVSNPAAPEEVAYYETPGDPLDVQVAWGFAHIADTNGVRVLDIADPEAPIMVGSYPSSGTANGLSLSNGYIYVANGAAGLLILRDSFSITGFVTDAGDNPIEGVTVTATGGFTAVTDETGAYGFSDLEPGTYTLSASKAGYSFAPASLEVTLPPNAFSQDFEGIAMTSSISGRVTEADGTPIAAITMSFTGGFSTVTDLSGDYSLSGLPAGSYTIIPTKAGYSFTPGSRTVTLPPDAPGQDFVGDIFRLFLPATWK